MVGRLGAIVSSQSGIQGVQLDQELLVNKLSHQMDYLQVNLR